ncbi:Aldehyde/histidinol dehydrogenase [Aspergillus ambiguus]|uniref:Aldehyde/histidinol dehydrogenase n=1 Tax=Aspergillus ambiguus TaxID=176160 RepID=UPI003CCE0623
MVSSQPFSRIVSAEIDGRCQNIRYRQDQLNRMQTALVQHVDELREAIRKDSDNSAEEVQAEICLALSEIRAHYTPLNLAKDLEQEYRVAHGKDNAEGKRGAGIVYIVPCSHTMFYSIVSAMSAAVAAGNCVIVELAQTTMFLPPLLRRILTKALDNDTFAVSEERPPSAFLDRALMVVQNDSRPVFNRSLVSSAGRTVAVVDRTARIDQAAEALVTARFAFGGRSPYAPDIVMVQEFSMKAFVESIMQHASKLLAGQNGDARKKTVDLGRTSPSPSLVDQAHKDPSCRILVSGSGWGIVEVQDRKSPLLQKKVDEKVLIVHPITSLDDAIDFSNSLGGLTATYAFAIPSAAKYLTQFIDSHISWVNHVPLDMLIGPALPTNSVLSRTRYTTEVLQVPRPQYITESSQADLVKAVLNPSKKGQDAWKEALSPLPPTKQRAGFHIGFFEQGIITGGLITLFSLVASVSTLGYYTFAVVKRARS